MKIALFVAFLVMAGCTTRPPPPPPGQAGWTSSLACKQPGPLCQHSI